MNNYTQYKDTRFILGVSTNREGKHPDADFMGSGLPLVGSLRKDETFNEWYYRKLKREVKGE